MNIQMFPNENDQLEDLQSIDAAIQSNAIDQDITSVQLLPEITPHTIHLHSFSSNRTAEPPALGHN